MASGYDVTIKFHQHHMIERVTRAVDAVNVFDVFCSCYTVILAVSQNIVQLLHHVSDFLISISKHVNDSSVTPHHT